MGEDFDSFWKIGMFLIALIVVLIVVLSIVSNLS